MTVSDGRHAVVFGCSGINGYALVNQLLSGYPSASAFSKVTAISNRPFKADKSLFPADDQLQVVSGIDLLINDDAALIQSLSKKVSCVDTITHVYYASYFLSMDPEEECRLNKEMLRAAVQAVETLSTRLSFVTLITGTKAYGIHLVGNFPFQGQTPLREDLPRIPEEYGKDLFYYRQVDLLQYLSAGKTWSWCEVGIAPFGNAHCLAQTMGIYLSIYREFEGEGAPVAFPGNEAGWRLLSNDSNQDIIARFCIHASLQPREKVHARAFNIADEQTPVSWLHRWPILAAYFGLEGVGPDHSSLHPTEYIDRRWGDIQQLCQQRGINEEVVYKSMHNNGSRMGTLRYLDFDRHLDLSRARDVGFHEELDTAGSWHGAFDRLREAKIMM
ncbi:SDR family oxidoreductase [Aspergillus tanneri]|uniref:PRISE-like Rossmann-fold domain-containing protein n=1 Tax=Aspergillus tanneri TaxID=1220188 RepID=A0A5M9MIK0_9EURO|nr:uncharacterized protein ATNIH1004_005520 [Aspergillus tanneri]KAA8646845.1 hypothetical protein ATNIH1004_005520 [Aspergillus tanneri]